MWFLLTLSLIVGLNLIYLSIINREDLIPALVSIFILIYMIYSKKF